MRCICTLSCHLPRQVGLKVEAPLLLLFFLPHGFPPVLPLLHFHLLVDYLRPNLLRHLFPLLPSLFPLPACWYAPWISSALLPPALWKDLTFNLLMRPSLLEEPILTWELSPACSFLAFNLLHSEASFVFACCNSYSSSSSASLKYCSQNLNIQSVGKEEAYLGLC